MHNPVVIENQPTHIAVERTDEDEVAIHATMPGDGNALVSLYLTGEQATYVAAMLNVQAMA